VIALVDNQTYMSLDREDGYFESLGALCFLLASIIFFLAYWRSSLGTLFWFNPSQRSLALLLLALLFLFGAGEELRWGQVFFDIETPDLIVEKNRKGEFSLHNMIGFDGGDASGQRVTGIMRWLSIEKLFSLFWFSYCVCLSIVVSLRPSLRLTLERLGIPLVPLGLGLFFMANHLLSKLFELLPTMVEGRRLNEVKEANFAFLFLLVSLYFYRRYVSASAENA
jgi:hypothetical protein